MTLTLLNVIPFVLVMVVAGLLLTGKLVAVRAVTSIEAYEQYSTAKYIDARWFDLKLAGKCDVCGLDDSPIVLLDAWKEAKCKWCAELDNINYHLRMKGTRRLKKGIIA